MRALSYLNQEVLLKNWNWRLRVCSLLACLSLSLVATASPEIREPVECQLKSGVWAHCLTVDVPENRATGGRTIPLSIVVLKAKAPAKDKAPIYLLAGGPGQSAVEAYMPLPEAFRRLRSHHDIILVDQRGTGGSHPLRCIQDKDPKWDLFFDEAREKDHRRQCVATWAKDTDLTAYTTDAAAADLEAVRLVLGHKKIIVSGVSYGTRLALRYLALYPDAVEKQILEGVLPPDVNIARMRSTLTESLQGIAALCRKDPACEGLGDPWLNFEKVRAQWAARPRLKVTDPRSGASKEVEVREDMLLSMVGALLYAPMDMSIVPRVMQEAAAGNVTPLLARTFFSDNGLYDGLYYVLVCAEDFRDMGMPRDDSQRQLAESCQLLPEARLPKDFRQQPLSQVPTLLLSGGLDPVTPPRYSSSLKAVLPQQTHIILPEYGHNISYVSCIQDAVIDFVETSQPTIPVPDCVKKLKAWHVFPGEVAR